LPRSCPSALLSVSLARLPAAAQLEPFYRTEDLPEPGDTAPSHRCSEGALNPEEIVTARTIGAFNILLLAAYWSWCALAWEALPERIPGHFSIGGQVTRWDTTTPYSWFGLTTIATVLVALCSLAGFYAPRALPLLNMPEAQKRRVRALPAARRARALEPIQVFMHGTGTCLALLFFLLQVDIYRTARSGAEHGSMLLGVLLLAIAPLAAIPWLSRASRVRLDEVERSGG
jgi:uncharacterized membrane protein